jgi:hypothetical protein
VALSLPVDADSRRSGGKRFVTCLGFAAASLVVNLVLFLCLVFSELSEAVWVLVAVFVAEIGIVTLLGAWAHRGRDSTLRRITAVACLGTALGLMPSVIWLIAAEMTRL